MIPHPRDPGSPHRAAPFLSSLVACGLVGRAEAIAALLLAGAPAQLSPCLRRARLLPRNPPTPPENGSHRAEAAKAVRDALQPLLISKATRADLAAAATRASAQALQPSDVASLLTDSVARHLRSQRNNKVALTGRTATAICAVQAEAMPADPIEI
jgi:hypothetical protein